MTRALLQQERSRVTRRALFDAASKLWRLRGFDEVSVEEVCAAAGIAKGAFYFYFPRKEHALVMLIFSKINPREAEITELLHSNLDTVQIFYKLVAAIAARVRTQKKALVRRAIEEAFRSYVEVGQLLGGDRALRAFFRPLFDRAHVRKEIQSHWDPELLATTMGWSVLQALLFWANGTDKDRELEERLRARVELITTGAAAARRSKRKKNRSA
jgi:AcrR family transcriptional regulator